MAFKIKKTIKKILKPKHTHKFTPSYRRPDIPTTPVKPRWNLTH
jgi:hypothetical protein